MRDKIDTSRAAVEAHIRDVEVDATTASFRTVVLMRALLAERDALQEKVKDLDARQYSLAYAIAGGEDAPGLLDSVSTDKISEMIRTERARKNDEFNSGYAAGHAAGFEACRAIAATAVAELSDSPSMDPLDPSLAADPYYKAWVKISALQPQQKDSRDE